MFSNATKRRLPNQITMLRLVLSVAFFVVLSQYQFAYAVIPGQSNRQYLLLIAIALFIIAAASDALDGYLARHWEVVSRFGRIMDPLCDKVLILGAFILLAGPGFTLPNIHPGSYTVDARMASGVYPWMVIIILTRELIVTVLRSELEGAGIDFSAAGVGKVKMIVQSVAVPIILFLIWVDPSAASFGWAYYAIIVIVYTTVIVTAISVVPYITRAITLMQPKREATDDDSAHPSANQETSHE